MLTSTYDPLSARLTRLQLGTDLDLGYAYDDVGNVTVVTDTVLGVGSGDQAALLAGQYFASAGVAPGQRGMLSATLERGPGVAAPATESEDPSPADWLDQVQEDIADSEYFITWQDETVLADLAGAYHAPNRAHDLRTYFTPSGIRVIRRTTDEPPWQLGLALDSYGYGTNVQAASSEVQLTPERERITYQRTSPPGWDVIEWFVNDRQGLEHGFTIAGALGASKLRGDEAEPLFLELAVTGDLDFALDAAIPCTPVHPIAPVMPLADRARDELLPVADCEPIAGVELRSDAVTAGDAVDFTTAGGVRVLHYSGLLVTDATGRELDAWFEVREGALRIVLDARGAVYPISVDPMLTTPDWTAESDQASAYFGYAVGTAGDVNGDGYDDVIVGAYAYDNGQSDEGRAFVYHGSALGLSTSPDWTTESDQADARLGISVGASGDVNGDGYDDVILGAYRYDNGQTDEGRTYVFTGTAAGLSTTPDVTLVSSQDYCRFGYSVGTTGDVNGDDYDDVIVGAPRYDNGQSDEGRSYVYTGTASGLSTTAYWSVESDQADAQLGWSVGTAGDVNGDGYDDVIVGALYYDDAYTDEGRVSVYTGTVTGLSTMADWTRDGEQAEAHLGVSVGWAGDVNDDGFADVIVGADAYDNGQTNEGAAFIYTGTVSGLGATAEWMGESDQASALFGWAVGTAGDVNGDGCSDVIIGAYRYDDGESNEGRAFVYYGLPVDQVAVTTMRTIAYTYDPLDRLVSATGAVSESYEYDAIGNLTSKGGVSYGYQDGAHVHAVTHLGGVERFAYDINGNMTERTERERDVRAGLRRRERLCTAARRIAVFAVR